MFDADVIGDPLLEFLDQGTIVGQPVSVEHVLQPPHERGPVADVRPSDVQRFSKRRLSPKDGKSGHGAPRAGRVAA